MGMGTDSRLRMAICGCGNRSRLVWQRLVGEAAGFELVGVQDIAPQALDTAVELGTIARSQCHLDLGRMLDLARPDVLLVCPNHDAHAAAIEAGLHAGCHVLVEKPFTTDVADALRLTELAESEGLVLGVVQNWRTKSVPMAMRRSVQAGDIGEVSHIFFRYVRDRELAHLPSYVYEERDPILTAVTIHHIDLFRYVLGHEIAAVEARGHHPRWSGYRDPSVLALWLETVGGAAISYAATFSSRNGHLPIESVQVEGELGTLHNESRHSEPPLILSRRTDPEPVDLTADVVVRDERGQFDLADQAVLENLHGALTRGETLLSSARDNLGTLAAYDAARVALREGGRVDVREHLAAASVTTVRS